MTRAIGPAGQARAPRLLGGHRDLAQWILQGGRSPAAPWAWRLQLRWHAWWFERLLRQQASRLKQPRPRQLPVFVLGFWRSGTTLLHEWLAALPGHTAPATWQCFNPASFLLTGAPVEAGPGLQRPMDAGWIAPHSPQEDEFALLLQGAPSLYRGFIDPRRLAGLAHELLADDGAEGPAHWVDSWLAFLSGVEQQSGSRRLVLKSPNHVFRLPAIERAFPDAPWVWIGRPAAEVWHSNLRMWRAMADTYGLWPVPEGHLEALVEACMARYVHVLDAAVAGLPAHRVLWVDFDELYGEPSVLWQRLAARLLPSVEQDGSLETWQAVVRSHPVAPAGTQRDTGPIPGVRQALFEAYDSAHARARGRWGRIPGR